MSKLLGVTPGKFGRIEIQGPTHLRHQLRPQPGLQSVGGLLLFHARYLLSV